MLDQQTIDEFVAFLSLGEKMEYNTRNILLRLSKYEADVPIEYFTADQFIGMFEKEGWVRFNHFKNIKSVIKKYILWRMYTDPDPLLSVKAIQAVHFAALDPTENFKRDYFGSFEDFYGFLTSLCGPCGDEEDPNLMFKVACSPALARAGPGGGGVPPSWRRRPGERDLDHRGLCGRRAAVPVGAVSKGERGDGGEGDFRLRKREAVPLL